MRGGVTRPRVTNLFSCDPPSPLREKESYLSTTKAISSPCRVVNPQRFRFSVSAMLFVIANKRRPAIIQDMILDIIASFSAHGQTRLSKTGKPNASQLFFLSIKPLPNRQLIHFPTQNQLLVRVKFGRCFARIML